MAKTTNELQDFLQQLDDLIRLAHQRSPQIKEPPNAAEQKLGEAPSRIILESGPTQASSS
jgi:hypothetical protein